MTEQAGSDLGKELAARVREAAADGKSLYIQGGGSKRAVLGRDCDAPVLDVSGHAGITDYQPTELVLTARAGTRLAAIEEALANEGQVLPFEPPRCGAATLGGTIACNLSGPARPWAGSARDLLLGVQLIDGRGELLRFGGKVMKNVAGYDVSRLQAGALGTLGVLSEISMKVLPGVRHSVTLRYEMPAADAIETMNRRAASSAPLTAASWLEGSMYLRLAGEADAVEQTARSWGGQQVDDGEQFWGRIRDMTLPLFASEEPLWRLSVKSTAPLTRDMQPGLIDWCGALRWVRGDFDLQALQQTAVMAGGNATLFSGGDRRGELRPRPDTVSQRLQQRLKSCFDPQGVFNPGRLYDWL